MATCCFTGHRPDKLGGYDYNSEKNLLIKKYLREKCIELILSYDVDTFIFGGALGIDQMAFDVVYELKEEYPNLKLIIAVPFSSQDCNWPDKSSRYYRSQLRRADKVIFVDTLDSYKIKGYEEGKYYPAKMQKRNEYMVDESDYILTYYDGSKGGTRNCLKYWEKVKNTLPINIYSSVNP